MQRWSPESRGCHSLIVVPLAISSDRERPGALQSFFVLIFTTEDSKVLRHNMHCALSPPQMTSGRVSFVSWGCRGICPGWSELQQNRLVRAVFLRWNVRLDFVLSERCCPRRVCRTTAYILVAYIRADECKCCGGVDRVWSQHKDKLAVSNCCAVMNAEPPCTERYLHRWIPFSPCSQIPAEIGVSVIMCIIVVMFHWLPDETFSIPPKLWHTFLPVVPFCSRLIYLQMRSPALTSTYTVRGTLLACVWE